jgi:3-oxoadipate enol-lactonase
MQKPHLLLIHGFPHDGTLWKHQLNALSDVAHVIAPDLRGFGGNTAELKKDLRIEDYANDLKRLLDEHGIEKVVVAGLSMGGYVALSFLEKYPDRARALILCNTRAEADDEAGRKKRYEVAEKALNGGVPVIARELLPKMLSEKRRNERPEEARELEKMMLRQRPEAIAAASKAMAVRKDQREFLRSIKIPVLIITGDQDPIMPLPTSESMHRAIEQSEMTVLKDAAHLSNIDRPEEFNAAVRDFLKKLPAH